MKRKIIYISAVTGVALAILIVSLVNRFKDRNKYTDVVITGHDENNMYFTVGSLSYSYNESDGVKKIKNIPEIMKRNKMLSRYYRERRSPKEVIRMSGI